MCACIYIYVYIYECVFVCVRGRARVYVLWTINIVLQLYFAVGNSNILCVNISQYIHCTQQNQKLMMQLYILFVYPLYFVKRGQATKYQCYRTGKKMAPFYVWQMLLEVGYPSRILVILEDAVVTFYIPQRTISWMIPTHNSLYLKVAISPFLQKSGAIMQHSFLHFALSFLSTLTLNKLYPVNKTLWRKILLPPSE
jgi:hypothetical protein